MYIDVFPTTDSAPPASFGGKTVLIIDVLRATSTIVTALANGAARVIPVRTVEEARCLAERFPPGTCLLGGERKALHIPGFDLENSPRQYKKEKVAGKTVILTTTNGTRAIKQAAGAGTLLIASFLNARAAALHAAREGRDISLLCAGTMGKFSLDDAACAGMLVHYLTEMMPTAHFDDFAYTVRNLYLSHKDDLLGLIARAAHYQRLLDLGLALDIDFCLQQDLLPVVPRGDDEAGICLA